MPTTYTHLIAIMVMQLQQLTLRAIAVLLRRHPSTISREIRRNSQLGRYDSVHAANRARELRHKPRRQSRLRSGSELFQVIIEMLRIGWSPQQIVSRLRRIWPDHPERHVSHETIYLAIYAYPRGELNGRWCTDSRLKEWCNRLTLDCAGFLRMPNKHNADRRHHIPKMKHRVTNWPQYEAGLRGRGSLTLWITPQALAQWAAPRRTTPGGQAQYSALAIETFLMLRTVFGLALRQTEGLMRSVLELMGVGLDVPDHTTVSRRSRGLTRIKHERDSQMAEAPRHILIDSTGLKRFGAGQ